MEVLLGAVGMQAPPTPQIQIHPRFTIIRSLGRGGYGEVYEAVDRERGDVVAIKRLHRATPSALSAFKREFRTLSRLVHPGLPLLYELFVEGDMAFLSMELLAGEGPISHVRPSIASAPPSSVLASTRSEGEGRSDDEGVVASEHTLAPPRSIDRATIQRVRHLASSSPPSLRSCIARASFIVISSRRTSS